jgi:hypothetical protein
MRDAAGFDDFCEYCECGVAHCDGSCRDECRSCGSTRCNGECCDDIEDDCDLEGRREMKMLADEQEDLERKPADICQKQLEPRSGLSS